MSIPNMIGSWRESRRRRKQDAYAKNFGHATPEEAEKIKGARKLFRTRLKNLSTGGLPDGTGISPTGTPIDFTADEKPPRY